MGGDQDRYAELVSADDEAGEWRYRHYWSNTSRTWDIVVRRRRDRDRVFYVWLVSSDSGHTFHSEAAGISDETEHLARRHALINIDQIENGRDPG